MIEKINQNTKHTNNTLIMDGMAYIKAFTTIFMPCHLDIALNGLKARRVRSERNAVRFALPSIAKLKIETYFDAKSKIVLLKNQKHMFMPLK